MRKVTNYINEKFTEDSDPINDLGIGMLYKKRNFETDEDAVDFMIEVLPYILKTEKIPDDVVYPKGHSNAFNYKYFEKISNYITLYINVLDKFHVGVFSSLYTKLLQMGYPKGKIKESLNEKFTEDSDPGMDRLIEKFIKEELKNDRRYRTSLCRLIAACALRNRYDFVEHLVKNKKVNVNCNLHVPLRSCAYVENYKMCNFLIKLGANLNDTINILEIQIAEMQYISGSEEKDKIILENLKELREEINKRKT
jgi:hypothetical protein